jgi:hypothetical protein
LDLGMSTIWSRHLYPQEECDRFSHPFVMEKVPLQ